MEILLRFLLLNDFAWVIIEEVIEFFGFNDLSQSILASGMRFERVRRNELFAT
jgi:hypothetical protein